MSIVNTIICYTEFMIMGLRITHIVLRVIYLIVMALIFVVDKSFSDLPFEALWYMIILCASISVMMGLALTYNSLPNTIPGMLGIIIVPLVPIVIYFFIGDFSWTLAFVLMTLQDLLMVIVGQFIYMKQENIRDGLFISFIVPNILALMIVFYYLFSSDYYTGLYSSFSLLLMGILVTTIFELRQLIKN